MSQQFNVSPDNLWMVVDYTPTSKTVVHRPFHSLRIGPWSVSVMAMLRELTLKGDGRGCIYSCDMEPSEKFIRRLLKFVFMILAFVVAFVLGEFSFGMGWLGAVILVIGASMGALA